MPSCYLPISCRFAIHSHRLEGSKYNIYLGRKSRKVEIKNMEMKMQKFQEDGDKMDNDMLK